MATDIRYRISGGTQNKKNMKIKIKHRDVPFPIRLENISGKWELNTVNSRKNKFSYASSEFAI